jgi:hypothetical protein
VLHADTVTRPASPDPLYGFEVVHREDGADDDQWPFKRASPFRSLLPRIWDVISASPPRPSYLKQIDYAQLPPLDGEEGELIDDEACFFCPPVRAVTGIGIYFLIFISNLTIYRYPHSSAAGALTAHPQPPSFPHPARPPRSGSSCFGRTSRPRPSQHRSPPRAPLLPRRLPHLGPPRLRQCRLARLLHLPLGCPTFAAYSPHPPLSSPAHLLPHRRPHEEAPPAPARRCLPSSSYHLTRTRTFLAHPLSRAPRPRAPLGVTSCYE